METNTSVSQSIGSKVHSSLQVRTYKNMALLLDLILIKAVFNLRSEVQRNYLSYAWWIIEPLLYMVVYYVVFGILLKSGGENFTVFLLTGLIPWMWFSKSITGSSSSILTGQNLMLQVGTPPILFPLVIVTQVIIKQLPVFLLLVAYVWLHGFSPEVHWWALIPIILVQAVLTTAVACAVAAIIPFIRDLSYLVPTGLTFLMFLSGVFYDYKRIDSEWQDVFILNPLAFLLKCYRDIFINATPPDFSTLAYLGAGSFIGCVLMFFAYQQLRYIYPRIVTE